MSNELNNPWKPIDKNFLFNFKFSGIKHEFKDGDGNIYQRHRRVNFSNNTIYVGDEYGTCNELKLDDCVYRYSNKNYQKMLNNFNSIKIGDFVKCTGSRGNDWRKILEINSEKMIIVGRKCRLPYNEFLDSYITENGIVKINKIMKGSKSNLIRLSKKLYEETMGVFIPYNIIEKLVESNEYLVDEYTEVHYDDDDDSSVIDTCVKDILFDVMSLYLIGEVWPTYADKNITDFSNKLNKAIEKKKWKILYGN